jgi:hypothetical protein
VADPAGQLPRRRSAPQDRRDLVEGHRELSCAVVTRRVGPRALPATEEITKLHPPRMWVVRAVGGPLTAIAAGTIEPLDSGDRSRVTIALRRPSVVVGHRT